MADCKAPPPPPSHVAIFVFPFASHPSSLLKLTRRLASASPPTTTFSFFGTEKSNSAIFSNPHNNNFPNIRPFTVRDGLPGSHAPAANGHAPAADGHAPAADGPKRSPGEALLEMVDMFMKAAPENIRAAVKEAEAAVGCKISCMVSDAFVWVVGDVAAEMGLPWVAVRTGGPRALVAHVDCDLIRATVGVGEECKKKTLDFIPGFSTTRCEDLPDGTVCGNLESPFAVMLHKMGQNLHKSTVVVISSFEEADPTITNYFHSKFQKCLHIGPSVLASPPPSQDEHGCIPWLDQWGPMSVLYISFGTMLTPPPNELSAIAEALLETGHPFLWSFKGNPSENFPRVFIEEVKERGKFVPWAPQLAVLRHESVGVFVTHCGWNSLIESVAGGVPMIGRPFIGDQQMNRATMEEEWKIGVGVEGGCFSKDGMVKALKMIMSQEEGKSMRARVCELKEAALKSMESNGSSTKNFKSLIEIINN